jgi:hypothetical protein
VEEGEKGGQRKYGLVVREMPLLPMAWTCLYTRVIVRQGVKKKLGNQWESLWGHNPGPLFSSIFQLGALWLGISSLTGMFLAICLGNHPLPFGLGQIKISFESTCELWLS